MHPQYHQAWQNLNEMERATRQNTAIREAIAAAGRPLSPTEVLDEARRHVAALGLATVYRNLKALVDAGEIQVVTVRSSTGSGETFTLSFNGATATLDDASAPQ